MMPESERSSLSKDDFNDALRRVGATEKLIEEINSEPEYCGVYWIITTCLTAIAIGAALGVVMWLWMPA